MEQIGSYVVMLILFILILYGSYVGTKKIAKISMRENRSKYMKLIDRMMLGQDRYVSIISVGNRYFLIGTSAHEINLLTELTEDNLVELENPEKLFQDGPDFKEIMKRLGWDKDTKR